MSMDERQMGRKRVEEEGEQEQTDSEVDEPHPFLLSCRTDDDDDPGVFGGRRPSSHERHSSRHQSAAPDLLLVMKMMMTEQREKGRNERQTAGSHTNKNLKREKKSRTRFPPETQETRPYFVCGFRLLSVSLSSLMMSFARKGRRRGPEFDGHFVSRCHRVCVLLASAMKWPFVWQS